MDTPAQPAIKENPPAVAGAAPELVVLCGNPNSGKTTLFNALTGLRARVGNYPGVTVERKEGRLQGAPPGRTVTVLDLPGPTASARNRWTSKSAATCSSAACRKSRRPISWWWWWMPPTWNAISTSRARSLSWASRRSSC